MAGRWIIQDLEFVVTDGVAIEDDLGDERHEARNVIAVVRPISRRRPRTMPRWAAGWHCTDVVAPDGASGLKIRPGQIRPAGARWWLNEWQVLVEGSAALGTMRWSPRSGTTFRECTCGQLPRKCHCGGRRGKLCRSDSSSGLGKGWRYSGAYASTVVDAEDHELARITPRWFDTGLGPESTRERFARWGREARRDATTLNAVMRSYEVCVASEFVSGSGSAISPHVGGSMALMRGASCARSEAAT
jgi:hypothetical protein